MKKSCSFIAGLAMLTGCAVSPDYQAPVLAVPATYTSPNEIPLQATGQHVVLGKQLSAQWWNLFASSSLNSLIRQAIANNQDLVAAQQRVLQANALVQAEQGAFKPQLSLTGTAGRQKYGAALFGPADFTIPPFTYYEIGPALSWSLDLFGGNKRSIEQQRAMAAYQQYQLQAAYLQLTGNVVAQALSIATTRARIKVTETIIAEDKNTLKLVEAAFKGGSGTKVEVLTAQSQLDADLALLPPLHQQLSLAQHALAVLAGSTPANSTVPVFSLNDFTLPQELPVSLPSELVRQRPDILAAEANLQAASAAVGVATANLYPRVNLSANLLQEALTPSGLFKSVNTAWALAAGLTAPLYDGGRLSAQKQAAEHGYQATLAQYKQVILNSFGQVADVLQALQHDADAEAAQQQAVSTARASLELSRKSYQAGNTGLLQIEDAARQLSRAQLGLIEAQSQRFSDTAQLFVVLGGSSPSTTSTAQ
ncbi:efflux transporter outer membrane subunit [Alkanindiges illinoisensis]|uniref:efflux transporter outer membrane subunit n=1 Tax=Alkanindiges illinoisensis TaxID=197183 RepID=UPI00047B9752|nr:efflux transporter outer membrane subunit [Alkanindiges illinoisensis]